MNVFLPTTIIDVESRIFHISKCISYSLVASGVERTLTKLTEGCAVEQIDRSIDD
jgi:hypothetical protein